MPRVTLCRFRQFGRGKSTVVFHFDECFSCETMRYTSVIGGKEELQLVCLLVEMVRYLLLIGRKACMMSDNATTYASRLTQANKRRNGSARKSVVPADGVPSYSTRASDCEMWRRAAAGAAQLSSRRLSRAAAVSPAALARRQPMPDALLSRWGTRATRRFSSVSSSVSTAQCTSWRC